MGNHELIEAFKKIEARAAEDKDVHLFELAQVLSGVLMTDSLPDIHDSATNSLIRTLTRIVGRDQ